MREQGERYGKMRGSRLYCKKEVERAEKGGAKMYRKMSREQREVVFLELAVRTYSGLEDWYEEHPEASFGEIAVATALFRENSTFTAIISFAYRAFWCTI